MLSIHCTRYDLPKGESWCQVFLKSVLLGIGGVMGGHLLISLSRHSEREFLVCCWVFFYCIAIEWVLVIEEVLRVALLCIEGGICVLSSCLTLVSLRMTFEGKLL